MSISHAITFAIQNAMYIFILLCNTIYKKRGNDMAFQLKSNKKETENKTIRFPLELIERIEKAIKNKDVTFSRFVIQACEYALENLESNNEE